MDEATKRIRAAKFYLRQKTPFFGTLGLYAETAFRRDIATAATDGARIYFNPEFAAKLTAPEAVGVFLHEVLHCAFRHPARRGDRHRLVFNLACDAVINRMIADEGHPLPEGAFRSPEVENLSVEAAYEVLRKRLSPEEIATFAGSYTDLLDLPLEGAEEWNAHWRVVVESATKIALESGNGSLPAMLARALEEVRQPRVDWKTSLWRFLARTPCDFEGFDRRFIGAGLYLEELAGESCLVAICCDTSGSIDEKELAQFLGEVRGILASYPFLRADLFYADADIEGPHPLNRDTSTLPPPTGGGGTSFVPFFDYIKAHAIDKAYDVAIYLTDGYGFFPEPQPEIETLWVVTADGLDEAQFPFGETCRFFNP